MHWPEGFWRSEVRLVCYLKAVWFVFMVYVSKLMKYRWVWSAHNVIPHLEVRSLFLERLMRMFVLRNFDLVIGLAYNTRNDLELAFGSSGRKYILAVHGTYEDAYPVAKTKEEFRVEAGIPMDAKVLLSLNTLYRSNKGIEEVLNAWSTIEDSKEVHLLLIGQRPENLEQLLANGKFHFIEGKIPDQSMGSLLNSVDFLVLNYRNMTTSGLFFLAITFGLPTIAPNLPFFKLHGSNGTTLFFDYNRPLYSQLEAIVGFINDGWKVDSSEIESMRREYSNIDSAREIARAFNLLT